MLLKRRVRYYFAVSVDISATFEIPAKEGVVQRESGAKGMYKRCGKGGVHRVAERVV